MAVDNEVNESAEQANRLGNKRENTVAHMNYRAIMKLAPEIVDGKYDFMRFQAGEDFIQITPEVAYEKCISVMHLYKYFGDMRRDTDMVLVIDSEEHTANARFFSKQPNIAERVEDDTPLQKHYNSFMSQWLKEIKQQGYEPELATYYNKITETVQNVYFNSDKKPFAIGMGHLGNGITVWNNLEEQHSDYKRIAHINHDRTVKFYENNLPVKVKEMIEETARTSEMSVSASQPYMSVFSTPPVLNEVEKTKEGAYKSVINVDETNTKQKIEDTSDMTVSDTQDAPIINPSAQSISLEHTEPEHEPEILLPDPSVGLSERDLYGYTDTDILPLLKDRALELFDQDHTIYMLYADGTEAMVFERGEVSDHNGIFGVETAEWIASREYADMVKALVSGDASKESALIYGNENVYGIYQLRHGDEMRDYLFEPFDGLQSRGLEVDRSNYELVYTAPLTIRDKLTNLNKIYETFNIDRPTDFTGHSLSVSDVIVLQWRGEVSSHYIDSIGFKELPAFLGNEVNLNPEQDNSYVDLIKEHINNHSNAGYLTAENEKILQDNIDTLNMRMVEISGFYERGMPLDAETDTIDRLFQETLKQAKNEQEKPLTKPTSIKKPVETIGVHKGSSTRVGSKGKPSLLSQLEKHKTALSQSKEIQKNVPKRENDKEV